MRAFAVSFSSFWEGGRQVRDSFGRTIDYVRVSITDRCNLRCVYCMPERGVAKRRHEDILSYEEIVTVCRALAELGVRKIKVTGGEALVRRGAADLVAGLKALPGVESVTLTTNGILLAEQAERLREAGLDGVNVSLDTLDPETYREMTRGGDLSQALLGVDAALAAGFAAVKINCVPFAGRDRQDLLAIALLARDRPLHVRFIEMMPLGLGAAFSPLDRETLRKMLCDEFGGLEPVPGPVGNGPARYFSLPGFCGTIGFIETLDHNICRSCNRLRLTADGVLKTCLHMDVGVSLKSVLAEGGRESLIRAIKDAVLGKPAHHEFGGLCGERRGMSEIGG